MKLEFVRCRFFYACFRSFLARCRSFQVFVGCFRSFLASCKSFHVAVCSFMLLQVVSACFFLVAVHFRSFLTCCTSFQDVVGRLRLSLARCRSFLARRRLFQVFSCSFPCRFRSLQIGSGCFLAVTNRLRSFEAVIGRSSFQ